MKTSEQILPFIPQRPPFVMIDEIVSADDAVSRTTFTIREGHLFVEGGFFGEPGLVENMAQTAAAGTGYKAQQEGQPAPVGFIGALKNLHIAQLPKVGDTLTTEVAFKMQVMNAHIVQATVKVNGSEIANCELKIFLQDN
ncbi:MAG: 3-hydroxyacyl-ACP dehydratase [Flavipsychrobacter sp.]|nr:3-hydroxyacyl-ACP dehydratase [Flavipsychrobacter sp.]